MVSEDSMEDDIEIHWQESQSLLGVVGVDPKSGAFTKKRIIAT
jgi:hypothetical protein